MIFIIAGPIHSGKTTSLSALLSSLTDRGCRCAGILSRVVFHNGRRIGYDLINIATKETMPLIRLTGYEAWLPGEQISFGNYSFSLSSFRQGNGILKNITGSDIIVIDEIGHLELRGEGFSPGLRYVLNHLSCPLVLVVRESLLSDEVSHFGIRSYRAVSVADETLLSQLLAASESSRNKA